MRELPMPAAKPANEAPIVWSIAGHDTSGGAGLSADQRAADAMGVHLCPVVAALTAQHSCGVRAVQPVDEAWLEAQLQALATDMPPAAIKTGLLGSVAAVQTVARWVDRLRAAQPDRHLPLIVDPVLGATAGGSAFSHAVIVAAYREHLLPRATLLTPNRAEALALLGRPARHDGPADALPDLAEQLRALGAQGVVITGGDAPHEGWAVDWTDLPQAQGWLCAPRVTTPHHHGSGCTFASAAAAAMACGHGSADAVVLAKMRTSQALRQAHAAGSGSGPVMASAAHPLGALPWLGLGRDLPWQITHAAGLGNGGPDDPGHGLAGNAPPLFQPFAAPADGLYGILPDSTQLHAAAHAGLRCLQLRHKAWDGALAHIQASARNCAEQGATLFINDHWQAALALLGSTPSHGQVVPASRAGTMQPDARLGQAPSSALSLGLHLGQEDLLALNATDRAQLLAARGRVQLGLSSHSVWELARAAGCGASYIACGPVQATTTKDMPWRPQGEHNLRWWVVHSPAPVVAIGGLLTPDDVHRFAACGPAAVCVVRGLGQTLTDMHRRVPMLQASVASAVHAPASAALSEPGRPHRSALAAATDALPRPVL
jgi:hydroxymethylpyrimidine kinase/phosphomethylpyrimidine kinase/thiamine-phosphate diphosphorylase